jgi:hypothetical protein
MFALVRYMMSLYYAWLSETNEDNSNSDLRRCFQLPFVFFIAPTSSHVSSQLSVPSCSAAVQIFFLWRISILASMCHLNNCGIHLF